ncbi:MAG: hypothetical protein ABI177_00675 [Edaphobacter sp.]
MIYLPAHSSFCPTVPEYAGVREQQVFECQPDKEHSGQTLNLLNTSLWGLLRNYEWQFIVMLERHCRSIRRREDELRGWVGGVLAREEMSSYDLDGDKSYDKTDDKEDACINHYMKEVTVIFWLVAVGGKVVLVAHTK